VGLVRSTPGLIVIIPLALPIQEGMAFLALAGFTGPGLRADFFLAATICMSVTVASGPRTDKRAGGKSNHSAPESRPVGRSYQGKVGSSR